MLQSWSALARRSPAELKALQNHQLRTFFRHQLPYSPYYRALFAKEHLRFEQFATTDDLQRIPFVSKADLAPTADDPGRPRQFMLQPDEHLLKQHAAKSTLLGLAAKKLTGQDVKPRLEWEYKPVHLHFTTGRTALPTVVGYSQRDLRVLSATSQRLFETIGIPHDAVVINAFPYAPHLAFWLTYFATSSIGLTALQSGGGKVMGTQKIIDAITRMKARVVTAIPGYFYHVLREAVGQKCDWSNLQYIVFGGERVSDGFRQKVKELLKEVNCRDAHINATYALTEGKSAWVQCGHEASGYHTYPDIEFFEVIDEHGNRVPEGQPGELVYTSLGWRGTTLVRYRTGDLVQGLTWQPCAHCRRTVPQISKDIQRRSDMKEFQLTKVKGELVNLNAFYPLLMGTPGVEEWQLEIRKVNNDPFEVDELVLHVAAKTDADFAALSAALDKKVLSETGVRARIVPKSIPEVLTMIGMESELKEKRIVDTRPKA